MQNYGSAPLGLPMTMAKAPAKSEFSLAHRRTTNLPAMILSLVVPLALYAGVFAALSFRLHYDSPGVVKVIVAVAAFLTFAIVFLAGQAVQKLIKGHSAASPSWYIFWACLTLLAFIAAVMMGSANYWNNTRPYCEITNLSAYQAIDPALTSGAQLMDAGRVDFIDSSKLDVSKAMGFKNSDEYCVAPIVGNKTQVSYDLWAVGLNCCGSEFHCGEFDNPSAHSGLRLVKEDQQGFFQLAVEQAQASYNLEVRQPLFFYWMQDPVADLQAYTDDALRFYVLGVMTFLAFQVATLVAALFTFRKLGIE